MKIVSLCKDYEFQRLYRRGKSAVRSTLVMYTSPTRRQELRLGITAGRKIGGAVLRNRAKRRIRELFRQAMPLLPKSADICIVARTRLLTAPHSKLYEEFMSAAGELGLLSDTQSALPENKIK